MNSINVNIPIVNLPTATQHLSAVQHAPIAQQAQNADLARDHLDLRMQIAREVESTEGKIVDPKDHKEGEKRRTRKGEKEEEEKDEKKEERPSDISITMSDSGRLIDLEA